MRSSSSRLARFYRHRHPGRPIKSIHCGGDVRKFEPKKWLKFKDIDESIRELRAIYKVHPEWFETPKPKSDKGQSAVDYSIK
jgi:hypothetical protein